MGFRDGDVLGAFFFACFSVSVSVLRTLSGQAAKPSGDFYFFTSDSALLNAS